MRTPEQILRSIVADVEGMGNRNGPEWYGPFPMSFEDFGGGGAVVEWPNLRILIDEAKATLGEAPPVKRIPDGAHMFRSPMTIPSSTAITLHSSHGEFYFDSEGRLLRADIDSDEWEALDTPQVLDIEEWKRAYPGENPCGADGTGGEHDILDWGFWTEYFYVEPEYEWRADFKAGRSYGDDRRELDQGEDPISGEQRRKQ